MTYIKQVINEKISKLQEEILKLQNENIDPLFFIREQIQNKNYRLRKMKYRYPVFICGLNLTTNRLRTLIANIHYIPNTRDFSVAYQEYKNGNTLNHKIYITNNLYVKELYKIWVKI